MPAVVARPPRSSRSLSPSLLPNGPHRYLPYARINQSFTFGHPQSQPALQRKQEMYGCDQMVKPKLAERHHCAQQASYRAIGHAHGHAISAPRYPSQRMVPTHRRAVSLSSVPTSQGFLIFPHQLHLATNAAPVYSRSHQPQHQQQARRHPHPVPQPLQRLPSPPLTPIVESPLPRTPTPPTPMSMSASASASTSTSNSSSRASAGAGKSGQLMLVTPTMAAFLKKGGSVSVRAADGKSWRIRAPASMGGAVDLVSPTCGMRMMRLQ